ncbi:hypothetical protein ASC89_09250 [Devosia sp. Root413D1]|uniref:autotransporter family protein n=1 Tax=Devosia sp. Root413D1 TaxID=1736531 RepID=UPI0006FC672D|nr:autotransporter outer membrane beta-barrel domain-containing protein [Devosia sp. Root413D1]KQW80269.1 hypothetical protein ASC89_09250 [Devosia sp. Root413D1]
MTRSTNGLIVAGSGGQLTIQNGSTLNSAGLGGIASGNGSTGTVTVTGTGSQWFVGNHLSIGGAPNATGTLNIENSAAVRSQLTRLAASAAGNGTLNIRSGGVLETGSLYTQLGSAQVSFDNATLRATGDNATFVYSQAGVNVSQFNIGAGGLTIDTSSFAIGAEGFSGLGGLSVAGTGTLTLTEASIYTGDTSIAAGSTLALSGAGSIASTRISADGTFDISAVTAAGFSTAYLGGTGTVVLGTKTLTADVISPGGDNALGELTINGNHVGTGNTLRIDTVLGGDSSDTDRLVITGDTSGTTNVAVTNMGGAGGVTNAGIRIIEVGGTSAGTFSLLGDTVHNGEEAVIGGAYLYGLYQDVGDGDWYLRNIIDDEPVFQPAAPVIEAYVGAALQAFNTTESLAQRIGNRSWSGEGNGLWGRIEAARVSIAPDSSTGAGYDVTTWQLQAGFDGVLNRSDAGSLVAGVNAQFGVISADISSASGRGSVASNGYGLGATLTWYGDEGFYLDAQGKLTWFDSRLDSETLGTTIVSGNAGFGYALSLEAGQEVALGDNWSVTPQAQLAYSAVDFDEFVSYGSTVALESGDSLLGRLGLSVDHQSEWQDAAGETGSTRLYGIANLTYEFLQGTSTSVGGDTLSSKADPLWAGIGLGGSIDWAGGALSLYGEANLGTSLNHPGDSYSLGVTAGIRGKL